MLQGHARCPGDELPALRSGGSAADAQHVAAELSGKFKIQRSVLPWTALKVEPSALAGVANDYE